MTMDESKYEEKGDFNGVKVYVARNPADTFHLSRFIALNREEMFARAGATADVISKTIDEILRCCDEQLQPKQFRSEITLLAQTLKYRLSYPVDEHCLLRMGFILSYLEGEPEIGVSDYWMGKKWDLVYQDPEAYAFFLAWGMTNSSAYDKALLTSMDEEYFSKRREAIRMMKGILS